MTGPNSDPASPESPPPVASESPTVEPPIPNAASVATIATLEGNPKCPSRTIRVRGPLRTTSATMVSINHDGASCSVGVVESVSGRRSPSTDSSLPTEEDGDNPLNLRKSPSSSNTVKLSTCPSSFSGVDGSMSFTEIEFLDPGVTDGECAIYCITEFDMPRVDRTHSAISSSSDGILISCASVVRPRWERTRTAPGVFSTMWAISPISRPPMMRSAMTSAWAGGS